MMGARHATQVALHPLSRLAAALSVFAGDNKKNTMGWWPNTSGRVCAPLHLGFALLKKTKSQVSDRRPSLARRMCVSRASCWLDKQLRKKQKTRLHWTFVFFAKQPAAKQEPHAREHRFSLIVQA
jgi:hypothetical protein